MPLFLRHAGKSPSIDQNCGNPEIDYPIDSRTDGTRGAIDLQHQRHLGRLRRPPGGLRSDRQSQGKEGARLLARMIALIGSAAPDSPASNLDLTFSTGLFGAWGVVGVGGEARWNSPWVGFAAGVSAGPIPTASLGLWWPRGGWRGGLQVAYGTTPWGVSCGVAPEYEDHSCHAVAGSINLVIEKNDLWRGLVLQGGVGPNLVGSGGAGFGFLGTLGLGWRW